MDQEALLEALKAHLRITVTEKTALGDEYQQHRWLRVELVWRDGAFGEDQVIDSDEVSI